MILLKISDYIVINQGRAGALIINDESDVLF